MESPCFLFSEEGLVGVRQTTHTTHDAQNVVIHGIHTEVVGEGLCRECTAIISRCWVCHTIEHEGSTVDTAKVTSSTRLVLLGLNGKGVYVDGIGGCARYNGLGLTGRCCIYNRTREATASVVLVRLDLPEIVAIPLIKPILTIDLKPAPVYNIIVAKGLCVCCT